MTETGDSGRRVQAWMTSWVAVGAAQDAALPILIPAYVVAVTGSAFTAGLVMGATMLAGSAGPAIGWFADRYRAHRAVLVVGCFGLAAACAVYGVSAERKAIFVLDALLLGASIAAVSTVAPVFVIGARLAPELEAHRLTMLNLAQAVGQMLLGAILASAAKADASYSHRFYVAAGVLLLLSFVVWLTTAAPARQINADTTMDDSDSEHGAQLEAPAEGAKQKVLTAGFGFILAIAFLTSAAYMAIVNQISNILPQVYGFSQAQTASLVSFAGIVAIAAFLAAGWMLRRKGAEQTTITGIVIRLVAVLGMALAGVFIDSSFLLVSLLVLALYASNSFVDLAVYPFGVRAASVPASEASGWIFASMALAGAAGSTIAGVLADEISYNAINWMAATAAAAAVVLVIAADRILKD